MKTTQEELENKYWKIGKFAKLIGKHNNTVDNWFKDLEKEKIHYVQRVGKEKVYDELDLEIAKYISQKRDEGWTLEAIYLSLQNGDANLEIRSDYIPDEDETALITERHIQSIREELKEEMLTQFKDLNKAFSQFAQEELGKKLLLEDKATQRQRRLEDLITQRRVVDKLRKEAKLKWMEQPEDERFIKVGIFRKKIENMDKKNEFIEEYVSVNYEKELLTMFGNETESLEHNKS
ncbi:hypothetical protein COA01_32210 [Bacillus cereus]|uniref:hypothetical protein n=1 Tax=Bacillus cereus TaxID=1396 RepID=UPI000BFBEAAB|nr:hypothetical protein [Bacillus cereus]PGP12483.1 hypothetical protein COA01_32210 [Bacillus cereus]